MASMTSSASLPSIGVKRRPLMCGSSGENYRVFGRGGPHDWSPPPLPRCAASVPKRYVLGQKAAAKQRLRLKQEEVDRLDFHGFGGEIEGLRALLIHKYSGSVRGWRIAMAPDKRGNKAVLFSDFCAGLKRIGYTGKAMTLWKALRKNADGADSIGLEHFEPDLASQLDSVAQRLADSYECGAAEAWQDMEREHSTRANFGEFEHFLRERDLVGEEVQTRRVFEALDMAGLGTLTCEDLQFLDHWAYRRFGTPLPPPLADLHDRSEEEPWSPPPAQKKPPPSLDEFRVFLERKYGTPARAWRVALDLRGKGAISAPELGKACRSVGWKHSHTELYEQLTGLGGGLATLRGLDPESAAAIDQLNEVIADKFGDVHTLWVQVLDAGDAGVVSRVEFVESARDLGLNSAQARLAFSVLDTAGAGWIAEGELGFLDVFESRLSTMRLSARLQPDTPGSLARSASSPMFSAASRSGMGSMPRCAVPVEPSSISAPGKSTRAAQAKVFERTHILKHRWLAESMEERCWQRAGEMLNASHIVNHRAIRSTPQGDIFRSTNQFYREGVKRLMSLQKGSLEEEESEEYSDEEEDDDYEDDGEEGEG